MKAGRINDTNRAPEVSPAPSVETAMELFETNEKDPRRKSMRLHDFNYATPSAYYVTICVEDRQCIFGTISEGAVVPSDRGTIAIECWREIPHKYPAIALDAYVVMPNHVHGVLLFPDAGQALPNLGQVVNWYKALVCKSVRRMSSSSRAVIWQRNYYDHVVRDEQDLDRIRQYILYNPGRWEEDEYYRRGE